MIGQLSDNPTTEWINVRDLYIKYDYHDQNTINGIDLQLSDNSIYIFEFKVDKKEEAIKQIKERKYYAKYQSENTEIFMVGINFDSGLKNISDFKWEKV